ncbi:alpha/beta hydrolase [Methylorubrum sp. SB2]|uniref:alpha/beta fold hydrolase n=1 Tax=Methylorubrum subtropicum TaxID=3138812 RepID=UPI00313F3A02
MQPAQADFRNGDFLGYAEQRFHRIAYTEWGDPGSPHVVVCLHGLSRQGRDFDALAAVLAQRGCRVVCPDLVGRGRSARLANPDDYALPQYVADMATLIAHLGVRQIDWIGTSLGGLVGMMIAAAQDAPIRRLVINDIGPSLPWSALQRIGTGLRNAPRTFPNLEAAETYLRTIHAPFGRLTDAQWRQMATYSFVRDSAGTLTHHYDPAIGHNFRPGRIYNVGLWRYWDRIRCKVLLLRGEESDLLPRQTAEEMTRRGPGAAFVEIAGCGHAPALMDEPQIDLVVNWITQTPAVRQDRAASSH